MGDPFKYKYKEEISQQQECMLDLNILLWTKNIWISLWFDKFKDTEGQKMVIYPKNKRYDVVVLEDWSAMAELSFMTKISEEATRTTITTMSFLDLADYIFGDKLLKSDMVEVLAISSTDESKLYEVLKKKSYISSRDQYFFTVTHKIEVEAFLSSTPMVSFCNVNDFSYKSLNETE
ncbi:putative F-box/FBD/LRR-repeat protein [Sesbania bispinosa]|nr:putative F-box/FBD/LRR-repeat protein [Sesbania bispinosa]